MVESVKHLVLAGISFLALLGVGVALSNLPVITGCGFYGQCGMPDGE